MKGSDGRSKWFIDKKLALYVAGFIFILVLVFCYSITRVKKQYENCAQLRQDGHTFIHQGKPLYQSRLDRNHNGIACET